MFTDSTLETEEYAFYSCGDSAKIEMINCSLTFDDRTFQYSSLESLAIIGSKVDMGDSVFSSCEDLVTVKCIYAKKIDYFQKYGIILLVVSPTAKWTAKSVSNSNGVTTQMAMRKRIAICFEEKHANRF